MRGKGNQRRISVAKVAHDHASPASRRHVNSCRNSESGVGSGVGEAVEWGSGGIGEAAEWGKRRSGNLESAPRTRVTR